MEREGQRGQQWVWTGVEGEGGGSAGGEAAATQPIGGPGSTTRAGQGSGTARHGMARHGMARHGTAWHGMAHGAQPVGGAGRPGNRSGHSRDALPMAQPIPVGGQHRTLHQFQNDVWANRGARGTLHVSPIGGGVGVSALNHNERPAERLADSVIKMK